MSEQVIATTTDSDADLLRAAGHDAKLTEASEQAKPPESQSAAAEREGRAKSSYQKRIDSLIRQRSERDAQIEELRTRLSKLEQIGNGDGNHPPVTAPQEANGDGAREGAQVEPPTTQQAEIPPKLKKQIENHFESVRNEFADMGDKVWDEFAATPITLDEQQGNAVRAAFLDCGNSGKILRHMMENSDFREHLQVLAPNEIYAEMLKLSGQLQSTREQQTISQSRPVARPTSNAPAPIRPVGGSSTRSSVPDDEVDYQTYAARRNSPQAVKERQRKGYGI